MIEDGLALIDATQVRIDRLNWGIVQRARSDPRVKVLTQLPGVGPFTALVMAVALRGGPVPGVIMHTDSKRALVRVRPGRRRSLRRRG